MSCQNWYHWKHNLKLSILMIRLCELLVTIPYEHRERRSCIINIYDYGNHKQQTFIENLVFSRHWRLHYKQKENMSKLITYNLMKVIKLM